MSVHNHLVETLATVEEWPTYPSEVLSQLLIKRAFWMHPGVDKGVVTDDDHIQAAREESPMRRRYGHRQRGGDFRIVHAVVFGRKYAVTQRRFATSNTAEQTQCLLIPFNRGKEHLFVVAHQEAEVDPAPCELQHTLDHIRGRRASVNQIPQENDGGGSKASN